MVKKVIFGTCFFLILTILNISADDGSWNKSFTINSGSIYSENDHSDIELVSEILIFTGEYTKAVFLFKNSSDKALNVECGFPVRYELNTYQVDDHLEIVEDPYGNGEGIPVLGFFKTLPLSKTGGDDERYGAYPEIIPISKYNNSRTYLPIEAIPEDSSLSISKNNKPVPIKKILVERYAGKDGAWITIHYKHNLNFTPGELSTVIVEYHQDLFHGSDGMNKVYLWNYIIGTGGTWKGSIGNLYFIKPTDWKGDIPGLTSVMENRNITILYAENYKPEKETLYSLRNFSVGVMDEYEYFANTLPALKTMWSDRSIIVEQQNNAKQNFVTEISSSSYLKDKIPVFTNSGVIGKANFAPLSAFDGYKETAWCENVPGDGIGEYIEFSLTESIWGITINNGFTRLPVKDWLFDTADEETLFDREIRNDSLGFKDYYTRNNRVKRLAITDLSGNILYSLELADQRDTQTFPGVVLQKGRYRFVIKDVYPGTKWEDTCLGEISFLEPDTSLEADGFISCKFYMEALRGTIFK